MSPYSSTTLFISKPEQVESSAQFFRARCRAFELPPVKDAVIVGADSPVGTAALSQTLQLGSTENFLSWEIDDSIVGAIIARESLVLKIGQPAFTEFVLRRIKPLMSATEIIRVDVEMEIVVEGTI